MGANSLGGESPAANRVVCHAVVHQTVKVLAKVNGPRAADRLSDVVVGVAKRKVVASRAVDRPVEGQAVEDGDEGIVQRTDVECAVERHAVDRAVAYQIVSTRRGDRALVNAA